MENAFSKNDQRISCASEVLDSPWVPNSSPSSFLGSASMVNFENYRSQNDSETPFFSEIDGNEDSRGRLRHPEKKRRLLPDQVQFLEKSFDSENKLDPERKLQLAQELGLQPRQISIWFQNRRARCKTKLLEKDFDALSSSYDRLKADYDALCKENERLKNEVHLLKDQFFPKMVALDPISPLDLQVKKPKCAPEIVFKQEDAASTARSDDSNSPRYTDGIQIQSWHAFEAADVSEFSQDEDERLSRRLLPLPLYSKLETECFESDLQPNSCNLGFPVQDQGTGFWQF